jgi:NACHT conflict system protein
MGRALGYDDAVRMLGGDVAKIHRLVDVLVGAGMIAAVGPFRDVLGWFDAKAELSRVTERLVTGLIERRGSLSRHERTERLRAAHVLLASAAFFEIMAESELPVEYEELQITAAEQRALVDVATRQKWAAPVPGPAESHGEFTARLVEFYQALATTVVGFGSGLAVWERVDASVLQRTSAAITALAEPAVVRFESMLGRLAAEFPEVAFWASIRQEAAVHARLRDITTGLAALGETLDAIASGRVPDERRAAISRAYSAVLDRPVAESGEVPAGLSLPTLRQAFIPQSYRTAEAAEPTPLSSENWWQDQPVRDDLLAFLAGQITSPHMTMAPLLILGQPGSGKSVLARVLAARLPASDFLPVLVPLRSVYAAADVQEQIEQAIRTDTGERIDWPTLARSAGDALPVVILDGFDELLQATGVSQTDYVMRVAAFQQREADQGRPVAVIVTSRTSVADRAKTPAGSIAVRLEPFDRPRVAAWLDTWNLANADHFRSGESTALALETAMRYPELAGQPLLLLMLAIYDAEGNGLRAAGTLRPDELYERLLERFARREVEKRGPGLPARERNREIEAELRKLSVVAFAMFNRGAQWVTEDELDKDLRALPGLARSASAPRSADGLRAPIRAAELALGSFFFVYRARATRDDGQLSAYEFLHATFGEFLVARLIHRVIREMIARQRATTFVAEAALEDGLLHALLSFAPIAGRRQVITFAHGMATDLPEDEHNEWVDLLLRLFEAAQQPRQTDTFSAYTPRRLTVPARIAAHTSNLLILMLCTANVSASRLLGTEEGNRTVESWHELALLWHSQGSASGWSSLIDLVQVNRVGRGRRRDIALSLTLDNATVAPPVDMNWVVGEERPAASGTDDGLTWVFWDSWDNVRREIHFTCDRSNDFQQHAIEPLHQAGVSEAASRVYLPIGEKPINRLGVFLSLLLDRDLPRAEREVLYRQAIDWSTLFPDAPLLLLHALELDHDVDARLVFAVVHRLADRCTEPRICTALVRCVIAHLDPVQEPAACRNMADLLLADVLGHKDAWTDLHLDAAIQLAELGLGAISISEKHARRLLAAYATRRPDFTSRIQILVKN